MLDKKSAVPLYIQAREVLLERIESGTYPTDEKIPSEKELCEEFGISRMTLRQVITWLVRDGKLYSIQGKGTYVSQPKITADSVREGNIRSLLMELERGVKNEALEVKLFTCPASIREIMGLTNGENIYQVETLGMKNGNPLRVDVSYIPQKFCSTLHIKDLEANTLDSILKDQYGFLESRLEETVEAAPATKEDASALQVEKGHPLLLCTTKSFNSDGQIYKYTITMYPGEKVRLRFL